jgi:hypothetical protein
MPTQKDICVIAGTILFVYWWLLLDLCNSGSLQVDREFFLTVINKGVSTRDMFSFRSSNLNGDRTAEVYKKRAGFPCPENLSVIIQRR